MILQTSLDADASRCTLIYSKTLSGLDHIELQVFEEVAHAEAWLRSCQRRPAPK